MTRRRISAITGAFVFLTATLAACGGSGGTGVTEPVATTAPKAAATPTAPPAPKTLMLLGDTVRGTAGLTDEEKAVLTCVTLGKFPQGSRIVWRIRVLDPLSNKALDDKALEHVTLTLPDGKTQVLKFGPHPAVNPTDFFWATGWTVPNDYPTGVFTYKVDAKSLEGATGSFGFDYFKVTAGQLTIVPAPFPKR